MSGPLPAPDAAPPAGQGAALRAAQGAVPEIPQDAALSAAQGAAPHAAESAALPAVTPDHAVPHAAIPETAASEPATPDVATRVVRWQASHGRNHLPWQNTRDPYRVWLSEIMLQQTQVATVLGYYERFLARFPDVQALAAAAPDDVLALWSGLGYYSRARNLHRCAQIVVAEHGGQFPRSVQALAALPGIGRSTAGAIASFCFGVRAPILDANVRRVLTRVLGFAQDLASAAGERALWQQAEALLPRADLPEAMPRYTQGLMDLGAGICLPRNPACLLCPLQDVCVARQQGQPERYPVRTRRLTRSAAAWWLLLQRDAAGRVWLQRRPGTGIWAGLYCPPVFDSRAALLHAAGQPADADADADADAGVHDLPAFTHVLTHRDLHLHPVLVQHAGAGPGAAEWPGAQDGGDVQGARGGTSDMRQVAAGAGAGLALQRAQDVPDGEVAGVPDGRARTAPGAASGPGGRHANAATDAGAGKAADGKAAEYAGPGARAAAVPSGAPAPLQSPEDGGWFTPAQWAALGLPAPVRTLLQALQASGALQER